MSRETKGALKRFRFGNLHFYYQLIVRPTLVNEVVSRLTVQCDEGFTIIYRDDDKTVLGKMKIDSGMESATMLLPDGQLEYQKHSVKLITKHTTIEEINIYAAALLMQNDIRIIEREELKALKRKRDKDAGKVIHVNFKRGN